MAKARLIHRSLSTSKKFNKILGNSGNLREFCQLVYVMILPHVDDFGRMQGDPWTVKNIILPDSPRGEDMFQKALDILNTSGLIDWYEVDGEYYVQVVGFEDHQTGLHKRTRSRFPEPSGKFPEIPSEENRTEENRTEEKGKGGSVEPRGHKPKGKDREAEKIVVYDGVKLHPEEIKKLRDEWGEQNYKALLRILGNYKLSSGKRYKSDYHAILSWVVDKCLERGWISKGKKGPVEKDGSTVQMCQVCRKAPAQTTQKDGIKTCVECDFEYYAGKEEQQDVHEVQSQTVPPDVHDR